MRLSWIDTPDALADVCTRARDADAVALDTEFVWERTYYPGLGLIQLGLGGDDLHLIDTVALEGQMQALGELLADPAVVKVLHDATQDLQILSRATGALPVNAFDTQRAGGFVGLTASASLQDLVEWAVGLKLDKGETRSNWLARPLSESQAEYAADDVRYLLDVYRKLRHEAEERGRLDWVLDEMKRYDDPDLYGDPDPHDAVDRVKAQGVGRLSGQQRAVLRSVSAWRETVARDKDRTRRMVLPDDVLAKVAQRSPGSEQDLQKLKLTDRQIASYGEGLLAAVAQGQAAEPEPARRRGRPGPDDLRRAARLLVAQGFLAGRCETTGLDAPLVATKSQLTDVVESGPESVAAAMPGWRYEFVGADLEALLSGDLAVQLAGPDGWPEATE